MALVFADRVKETTTTSGSTASPGFTLGGASTGYRAFTSVMSNNDTCYYCCVSTTGDWEVGLGTFVYASNVLDRTTVLSSSAGGTSRVSFGSEAKDIFLTVPSSEVGSNTQWKDTTNGKTYRIQFTNGSIETVEV